MYQSKQMYRITRNAYNISYSVSYQNDIVNLATVFCFYFNNFIGIVIFILQKIA